MLVQSFLISKPEQVHHFQIRLPRNAKQVVAIDYDVIVKTFVKTSSTVTGALTGHSGGIIIPKEANPNTNPETPHKNSIDFNWNVSTNPSIGKLKLQSLETANIFYSEWIKLLEWNIGVYANGIFPYKPHTLLQKQVPKLVEVSTQTTMLNGLYEDVFLNKDNAVKSYLIKVCVWLEMNEPSNGVDFEFINSKNND